MEVASAVLGVVPILLTALESYPKLYRLLKRYKKCRNGTHELLECLEIQEVIFRNETMLLLSPILGSRKAREMVQDCDHLSWKDPATELDAMLGESKWPLRHAASRVCRKLDSFHKELEGLDSDNDKTWNAAEDKKRSRNYIRRRFKYTFSEKRLTDLATAIRKATKDFRVLRAQVHDISHSRPNKRLNSDEISHKHSERLDMTRAAAKRIYEALSNACTMHVQHQAHVSLNPSYGSFNTLQVTKFKLAFHQAQHSQSTRLDQTLWFVVETLVNKPVSTQLCSQPRALTNRPPSPILESLQAATRRLPKKGRFNLAAATDATFCPSPLTTQPLPQGLPNLTLHHNFCAHLRISCDPKTCQDGLCIGLLEDSEDWKLPVYSSVGPVPFSSPQTLSLDNLSALLTSSHRQSSNLDRTPIVQRLRYARLLSQAVLSFFATPWMKSPWTSKDIIVYNASATRPPSPGNSQEAELFVKVSVRDLTSRDPDQLSTFDQPFIHNAILFNLGVVLLELAHERPVQQMRIKNDNMPGLPPAMADCFAAFRQAKETTSCLGPKYSDIVRKCLHCDFGHGWDLQNPSLQDAVHREVVSELDRLEMGVRELGIG